MSLHEKVTAIVAELHPNWPEKHRESFIALMYSVTGEENERGIGNFILKYEAGQ